MQQSSSPDVRTTPPPAPNDFPAIAVSPDQLGTQSTKLDALQERAMRLELRLADLSEQTSQLRERLNRASPEDRPRLEQQVKEAQHDMSAASIELSALQGKIAQIMRSLNPQTSVTVMPPAAPVSRFLDSEQIMQLFGGAGMLMIPLVLVMARNLWIRGNRKTETADIESSPRLQRIEQAIEAIAVEVERIGEAQRFSTKLLSERQPDAMVNRAASPVPRVITPH